MLVVLIIYDYTAVGTVDSILICVTPLISIMMEQKSKFTSMGIRAEYVGESQVDLAARTRVLRGEVELVF